MPQRQVLDGIFYVLRTGGHWKAAPPEFGSGSSLHRYFQRWQKRGLFRQLWQKALHEYDDKVGIDWEWQSLDGTMTKAPLGGKDGQEPHRSGQKGTKRSLLTDGRGVPLGLEVAGANRADMKLVEATLDSIPIERPEPTPEKPQHFLGDKGYDYPLVRGWWPAGVTQPTSRSRRPGGQGGAEGEDPRVSGGALGGGADA